MGTGQTVAEHLKRVAVILTARRELIACVEIGSGSCVSQSLTAEAGSSAYFAGSFVLPTDASHWPTYFAHCGISQQNTPRKSEELQEVATVAGTQFGARWVLVVDCAPPDGKGETHIALLAPDGNCAHETVPLAQSPGAETSHYSDNRLVQYVLQHLAERLEDYSEYSP